MAPCGVRRLVRWSVTRPRSSRSLPRSFAHNPPRQGVDNPLESCCQSVSAVKIVDSRGQHATCLQIIRRLLTAPCILSGPAQLSTITLLIPVDMWICSLNHPTARAEGCSWWIVCGKLCTTSSTHRLSSILVIYLCTYPQPLFQLLQDYKSLYSINLSVEN